MTTKQKILLPALGIATVAGLTFGAHAYAQTTTDSSTNYPPFVQNLMEKFDLSSDDVQSVMDETQTEMQQAREEAYTNYLDEAVTNGDITAEQEQLILDKHDELEAAREQERTDLQNWADENGIDLEYLRPGPGGPGGHGGFHGHGMGMGMMEGFEN